MLLQIYFAIKYDTKMKILVAEDQPLVLQSIIHKLKKEGYDVLGAIDGEQAKEFYAKEKPDLVITDVLMPFVTGPELIHYIRSLDGYRVPIIVLSQILMEKDIVKCFQLGADDYITKPFLPKELVARINRFERQIA